MVLSSYEEEIMLFAGCDKMKTTLVLCALLSVLPVIGRSADLFYLTNSVAHTNYGPFAYDHGATVTIDTQQWQIRRILTADECTEYRLRTTVILFECKSKSGQAGDRGE